MAWFNENVKFTWHWACNALVRALNSHLCFQRRMWWRWTWTGWPLHTMVTSDLRSRQPVKSQSWLTWHNTSRRVWDWQMGASRHTEIDPYTVIDRNKVKYNQDHTVIRKMLTQMKPVMVFAMSQVKLDLWGMIWAWFVLRSMLDKALFPMV